MVLLPSVAVVSCLVTSCNVVSGIGVVVETVVGVAIVVGIVATVDVCVVDVVDVVVVDVVVVDVVVGSVGNSEDVAGNGDVTDVGCSDGGIGGISCDARITTVCTSVSTVVASTISGY